MTDDQLRAIRERAERAALPCDINGDDNIIVRAEVLESADDVPALLEEGGAAEGRPPGFAR